MVGVWGNDGTKSVKDTWEYVSTDLTASTHIVSVTTGGNVTLSLNAGNTHAGKYFFVLDCMDGPSTPSPPARAPGQSPCQRPQIAQIYVPNFRYTPLFVEAATI